MHVIVHSLYANKTISYRWKLSRVIQLNPLGTNTEKCSLYGKVIRPHSIQALHSIFSLINLQD